MARKTERFKRSDSYSYSTGRVLDLIISANALTRSAAQERQPAVFRNVNNHASRFAPAAILLGVTALELFLNRLIVALLDQSDLEIQKALDKNTIAKLDFLRIRHQASTFYASCRHTYPRPSRRARGSGTNSKGTAEPTVADKNYPRPTTRTKSQKASQDRLD
jgi:hypothetical protein